MNNGKNIRRLLLGLSISLLVACAGAPKTAVENTAPDLSRGLVAHWTMDSDQITGSTLKDSVGTHDGLLVGGVSQIDGKVGGALELDGKSGYVTFGNILNEVFTDMPATPGIGNLQKAVDQAVDNWSKALRLDGKSKPEGNKFSISLWVKPSKLNKNTLVLVKSGDSACNPQKNERQFSLIIGDGYKANNLVNLYTDTLWNKGFVRVNTPKPPPVNEWTHIVFNYDESVVTDPALRFGLFLNGEKQPLYTVSSGGASNYKIQPGKAPLAMGIVVSSSGPCTRYGYYAGGVDDLRIYDRLLNEAEAKQLAHGAGKLASVSATSIDSGSDRAIIKEIHGIRIEAKSCELTEFRTIVCRLVVTSKNQDRTLNLLGTGYTRVQDDTGKTYPARISFGDSAEGGQVRSVLIADTPYNVTLIAENISSRAAKVRAIDIARMDIRGVGSVKLVLSSPPMVSASESGRQQISSVVSKSDSPQISEPSARKSIKEFRGVVFEAKSCELTEFRTILCRLVVTSRNQDRTLNLLGTGYTRVQDDTGKTYPARISFGDSAEGGQIRSVLIADTPYNVTLIAENISSRAAKVRAIDIARMDIRGVGSVKLILAHPPMVVSQGSMNETTKIHVTPTGSQRISSKATASTVTAPAVTTPAVTTPAVTTPAVTTPAVTTPSTPSTPKPQKPTPASNGGQAEAPVRSTVSAKATLPGCWNWSNSAYVIINADGTARTGPFAATWKTIDVASGHYTITWPSFVDTLAMSADGSALSGTNNFGFPVSATRKSGKASGVVGSWLWSSGVTMDIRSDSSVSGGVFRGTWSKAGNNWVFEWPLVDTVSLAADGRSLSAKNQFGPATARRDASCKGK